MIHLHPYQETLIRTSLAAHNFRTDFLSDPPGTGIFSSLSKTYVGKILASNSAKVAAGFLIVVGLSFSASGFGIGLIAAGATLWVASTATSAADLHDKGAFSCARHLSWSVLLGVAGAFAGLSQFGSAAALITPKLAAAADYLQWLSVLGPLVDLARLNHPDPANSPPFNAVERPISAGLEHWDSALRTAGARSDPFNLNLVLIGINGQRLTLPELANILEAGESALPALRNPVEVLPFPQIDEPAENLEVRPKGNFVTDLVLPCQPAATPAEIEQVKRQLSGFDDTHHAAVRYDPFSGEEVTFHLANGRDLVTFDTVAETMAIADEPTETPKDGKEQAVPNAAREWIAVLRSDEPVAFDLMLKSTYEHLPRNPSGERRNPVSRMLTTEAVTVRGKLLADLLNWPAYRQ